MMIQPIRPYSDDEWIHATSLGLNLDDWNDYVKYFEIGEQEEEY